MQLKLYQFILIIIIWAINKPKPRFQRMKKIFYLVRSCISQFTLTITWLVSDLPWRLLSSPCILRSKQSSSVTIPQPFTCDGRHGSWLQPSCTPILLTELRVRKKMSSCIGFHHSILTRSVSLGSEKSYHAIARFWPWQHKAYYFSSSPMSFSNCLFLNSYISSTILNIRTPPCLPQPPNNTKMNHD